MTLEEYLEDQYHRDLQDISAIEEVLVEVANLFEIAYDGSQSCWPYEVRTNDEVPKGEHSQGTSAMILAAIGKMVGRCTHRDTLTPRKLPNLSDQLIKCFEGGVLELAGQLKRLQKVESGTFGDFDPLTISHLSELKRGIVRLKDIGNPIEAALATLPKATSKITNLVEHGSIAREDFLENGDGDPKPHWCGANAFIILRIARAFVDLTDVTRKPSGYKTFFETRLHEQLSFSSIPDSRFDPAELAFCLEGLLICARESVDPVLFSRVFSVMAKEQETSAYWRPNRPFIAEPTGEVMLPLSVEGANSLLRSIDIVDEKQLYGTFAATALPMFRRFWQWLRARKVEIAALGTRCIGWHSEHVNEAGVIHLWDTSQVVEFLMGFRKLLHSHIARETLVRSRVKVGEPQKVGDWDKITQKYEPLTDEAIASRVFDLVYSDFVVPWRTNQESRAYSMLLYGPPGTGKTTIASSIANALKFRLITITVSDFLGAGGAMVEARAKAIFQMLEAQSDCVILFDEIDSFLLDRDSEHYRQQDTLFKFLTPGMLTKINDLRKGERSIFIIATNYANRIDPAIKRVGRVDKQYLLLSPDQKKRAAIIKGLFPKGKAPAAGTIDQMARESVFLGYSEIEGAIKDKLRRPWSDAIEALRAAARSSSDKHYLARVQQETTFPEAEFVAAIKLVAETGKVSEVKKRIKVLSAKDKSWGDLIKRSPDMESQLRHLRVLD